jgi:hypothetical protein
MNHPVPWWLGGIPGAMILGFLFGKAFYWALARYLTRKWDHEQDKILRGLNDRSRQ